jgi:hypothetical protein
MNEDPNIGYVISIVEREEAAYTPKYAVVALDIDDPPFEVGPDMLDDMQLLKNNRSGEFDGVSVPFTSIEVFTPTTATDSHSRFCSTLSFNPSTSFLGCLEGSRHLTSQLLLLPDESSFKIILDEQIDVSTASVYIQ